MAKWFGKIGYAEPEPVEVEPGIWGESIVEIPYSGDKYKNARSMQNNTVGTNDNINVSIQISIVADPYAIRNFLSMRYVVDRDVKWEITNVDEQYPRLILTVGGVYNG